MNSFRPIVEPVEKISVCYKSIHRHQAILLADLPSQDLSLGEGDHNLGTSVRVIPQ